jgi:hypothetical protein
MLTARAINGLLKATNEFFVLQNHLPFNENINGTFTP